MNLVRFVRRTAVGFSLGVLAGCSHSEPYIQAATAPDYTASPKRVSIAAAMDAEFIVRAMGHRAYDRYSTAFRATLLDGLGGCGVATDFYALPATTATNPSLPSNDAEIARRHAHLEQFGPDSILVISVADGRAVGNMVFVKYKFDLVDMAGKRSVWKALVDYQQNIDFSLLRSDDAGGGELARDVVDRMSTDGILRSCPAHKG